MPEPRVQVPPLLFVLTSSCVHILRVKTMGATGAQEELGHFTSQARARVKHESRVNFESRVKFESTYKLRFCAFYVNLTIFIV